MRGYIERDAPDMRGYIVWFKTAARKRLNFG